MENALEPIEYSEQTSIVSLDKILIAAEIEFADKGFDGAGMKALAKRANVSQSLLHYHFGSKDKLYEAVIRERSRLINDERMTLLKEIDLKQSDALENIFGALFAPALGPSGGGRAYARIFAGLIAGSERDQVLVRKYYDSTASQFIDALEIVLPDCSRFLAAQIYQFALGVLAPVIARDGRAERLGNQTTERLNDDASVEQLVRFVVGGARAILSE